MPLAGQDLALKIYPYAGRENEVLASTRWVAGSWQMLGHRLVIGSGPMVLLARA
jgi:hypothetical protein